MQRYIILFLCLALCTTVAWSQTQPLRLHISGFPELALDEPVYLLASLLNESDNDMEIVDLEGEWAGAGIMNFEITGPKGVILYSAGLSEKKGWEGEITIATLAPATRSVGEFNLSQYAQFNMPGTYHIKAIYYQTLSSGEVGQFVSNDITINISGSKSDMNAAFIGECLSIDGQKVPSSIYGSDNDYYFQTMGFETKYLAAIEKYKDQALTPYLAYYLGRYYFKHEKYNDAIAALKFVTDQKAFALTDDALLHLGLSYERTDNSDSAQEAYQKLIKRYAYGNCFRRAEQRLK